MGHRVIETRFKKYSWTKYGSRKGLLKEKLDEWSCQVCGDKHVKGLPSYYIPEDALEHEYMRLCSYCFHNALTIKVPTYQGLLGLKVANMLTLPARY